MFYPPKTNSKTSGKENYNRKEKYKSQCKTADKCPNISVIALKIYDSDATVEEQRLSILGKNAKPNYESYHKNK